MTAADSRSDVAVLGAGIMGCCLALELAQRGYRVDLIERAAGVMTGASLHNEGKLHLGFVYAKDPLKASHRVILRGSLAFANILEGLTGCGPEALMPSQPFYYFVPGDSQLDMQALTRHFEEVEQAIHEETRNTGNLYLGRKIGQYQERNAHNVHCRMFSDSMTLGSFRTEELSVSTPAVADALRRAVQQQPRIEFIGNTEVVSAERRSSGVRVETRRQGRVTLRTYACAANCLWADKLKIDRTAGVPDQGQWLLRYKAAISISAPAAARLMIPSATGVLGAYGDVVNRGRGSYYLSWYPLCKLAQADGKEQCRLDDRIHTWEVVRGLRKVSSRFPVISKRVAAFAHRKFISENISAMAAFIPALEALLKRGSRWEMGGGVILARGSTDINDPESYLHQRSAIGPAAYGPYVTVDTGKYCTAPLFAVQTADMIAEVLS